MPKGEQRPGKFNKPKLSTKEKQKLKREKKEAKKLGVPFTPPSSNNSGGTV